MHLLLRGLFMLTVLMAAALTGCKQKSAPPQVVPLPKKPQPAATAAVNPAPAGPAQVKPVQSNSTTAKNALAKSAVQNQPSSVKRPAAVTGVNLDFTNRRDPFKPFVQAPPTQLAAAKSGRKQRDALPIQSVDTDRFKVSGIITGIRENSALIIDPNGKGYVVKVGMQVGNNDGVVRRISDNTVEIEETFRDDNGKVRKRTVKLTLLRKK